MIHEIAKITVLADKTKQFEDAVSQASQFFEEAQGCRSFRLERSIEEPNQYRLVIGWESVEDHVVTFKSSGGFQKWRELASPFFQESPTVEHVERVFEAF